MALLEGVQDTVKADSVIILPVTPVGASGAVNRGESLNGCVDGKLPCIPHFHARYPSTIWRLIVMCVLLYTIISPIDPPLNVYPLVPTRFGVEV